MLIGRVQLFSRWRVLVTTLSPSRDAADSSVTIARDKLDLDDEVLHYKYGDLT